MVVLKVVLPVTLVPISPCHLKQNSEMDFLKVAKQVFQFLKNYMSMMRCSLVAQQYQILTQIEEKYITAMSSASWPTLSSTKIVGDYDARLDYGVPSGLMGLLQIQGGKSGSSVIVLPGGHIRGLAQLWDALEPRAITMDGCTV